MDRERVVPAGLRCTARAMALCLLAACGGPPRPLSVCERDRPTGEVRPSGPERSLCRVGSVVMASNDRTFLWRVEDALVTLVVQPGREGRASISALVDNKGKRPVALSFAPTHPADGASEGDCLRVSGRSAESLTVPNVVGETSEGRGMTYRLTVRYRSDPDEPIAEYVLAMDMNAGNCP